MTCIADPLAPLSGVSWRVCWSELSFAGLVGRGWCAFSLLSAVGGELGSLVGRRVLAIGFDLCTPRGRRSSLDRVAFSDSENGCVFFNVFCAFAVWVLALAAVPASQW